MAMVGSSMVMIGSGLGFSSAQKLSPMVMPGMPATATMSPTVVSSVSSRLRPLKVKSLVTLTVWSVPSMLREVDLLAGLERAVEDARDGEAAEVVGVVEVGDEDLEVAVGGAGRGGDGLEDELEERLEVGAGDGEVHGGGAGLAVGVDDGELEDGLVGVEVDEEVVDLVEDFLRTGVGAVDLVDDDDGRELGFERLREHVAGLRQRAFGGVDEQDDAVDHLERALDFAAEVGVAGRVDDVDLGVVVVDRGVLGEDGDAALFFEVVGVHDALGDGFVGAEGAGLAEHGVDERGLAVVDVGDDGDVADGFGGCGGAHGEGTSCSLRR